MNDIKSDAISDAEILNLSKQLHDSDANGVIVTLDLQSQTTAGNLNDLSPNRFKLFKFIIYCQLTIKFYISACLSAT